MAQQQRLVIRSKQEFIEAISTLCEEYRPGPPSLNSDNKFLSSLIELTDKHGQHYKDDKLATFIKDIIDTYQRGSYKEIEQIDDGCRLMEHNSRVYKYSGYGFLAGAGAVACLMPCCALCLNPTAKCLACGCMACTSLICGVNGIYAYNVSQAMDKNKNMIASIRSLQEEIDTAIGMIGYTGTEESRSKKEQELHGRCDELYNMLRNIRFSNVGFLRLIIDWARQIYELECKIDSIHKVANNNISQINKKISDKSEDKIEKN